MPETPVAPTPPLLPFEWPTVALAAGIYGGWLVLTWWHEQVPLALLVAAGAWLVCWHSSLQHEVLHGHPTRHAQLNRALALPPLALWLPFDRYRALHLKHHHDERLTDPLDDPESRYHSRETWAALGAVGQRLVRAQSTLIGRLTIGPFWAIGRFLAAELTAVRHGDSGRRAIWLQHLIGVAAIIAWLVFVCRMNVGLYLAAFVLPGTALMLVRSFAEHRADAEVGRRTAVVEDFGPLAWLYLFNNLHAAHHAHPRVAWYRLPALYRAGRCDFVNAARGPFYSGYGDVFRRFLFRPHDQPVHPLGRIPQQSSK
jgi:fatty acid desaturase